MLLYSKWLSIPLHVRAEIASKFGVAKTGPTHVQDNVVVADGYKIQDVENALNLSAIQDYLGVDHTDMNTLFDLLVARIEGNGAGQTLYDDAPLTPEQVPPLIEKLDNQVTDVVVPDAPEVKPVKKRVTKKK